MKRILSLTILITVCLFEIHYPAYADGFENFTSSASYSPGQFVDVDESDWFAPNIRSVYECDIMRGTSDDYFDVNGEITAAQAITIACRIHQIYNGTTVNFENGDPWYQPYVAYAHENRIIGDKEADCDEVIDRYEFAMILGESLPDEALPEINSIEYDSIPDVCRYESYCESVYRLYRAGVLSGNDEYGMFTPCVPITRSAAAAIVSRMIDPDLRKSFELMPISFEPVPMHSLSNLRSLQKNASDNELAQAYEIARGIVTPIAYYSKEDQLYCIASSLRNIYEAGMTYSMTDDHYNDPYGYLVLGSASCAGCVRATGLCLNMLGIPYEHVNENQYSHQWARVNIDGVYWICDAYGLYCGPEPAPYEHPYL